MGEKFLISGGIPRVFGELVSGHVFKQAELAEIDFENEIYTPVISYKTPPKFCSDTLPSITFGCFYICENVIYLPTRTEVLIVDRKTYKILDIITDPLFNDIHDVYVFKNKLYVAVTGLDAVFVFDLQNKERKIISILDEGLNRKHSKKSNLNKVVSLKPHKAHPNHLFELNDEIWVTRLKLNDAVCLTDLNKRINITDGLPHDGIVRGNLVYFTTVNGNVVICDTSDNNKTKTIKLTGAPVNGKTPLGWCRGLYVDDTHFYVGFTQLRTTKITENLDWVKNIIQEKKMVNKPLPTRIEKYTLNGEYVSEFKLPKEGIYNVFSIHKI